MALHADYRPYVAFLYDEDDIYAIVRIEDLLGATRKQNHGDWIAIIQYSDNYQMISGFKDKAAVNRFLHELKGAMEDEEYRQDHNASLVKRG